MNIEIVDVWWEPQTAISEAKDLFQSSKTTMLRYSRWHLDQEDLKSIIK